VVGETTVWQRQRRITWSPYGRMKRRMTNMMMNVRGIFGD
jgi:hypothetical protein